MRDRIMHMQEIKVVKLGHFSHAGGQRQVVRRVLEQRVARNFHFVIVNIRMGATQPNRLGVRNEVNFVVTLGQFHPQFGRDHAAASIGGIAGDADFHACPFRISARALQIRWRAQSRDSILPGFVGRTLLSAAFDIVSCASWAASRRVLAQSSKSKTADKSVRPIKRKICKVPKAEFSEKRSTNYPAPWGFPEVSDSAAMVSICCCSRSRVLSSRPVNSIPMPTPPSQDRTTAGVLTRSVSNQKVIFRSFPMGRGSMVST